MTKPPASGTQIAKGAAWLMGFKLLDKSIGLISTLVLVRILTPSDFGLVAMAMSIVALLELMGAFGFDSALIQRQDTARSHFDTAWTFNVIFGASIAALLLVLAVPAADFYREPRLALMLPALAIGAVFTGFENIGTVAFRKELNFSREFRFLLTKRVAAFVVTITAALTLQSFWALIIGIVAGKIMGVFISYRLHPYRPRFSLAARGDLFNFSKWLFISNLIQFLHSRSTDFILGRTVGSYGLGVYNLAAEIASLPSTELIAPLNRAVYPAYAQLSKSHDKLMARFLEVYGLICLISFPVAAGLYCLSGLVVNLLLGPQWQDAIPIMQILGLCGLVGALQGNMYIVMSAMGKPKANTILSGTLLAISLPVVILASLRFGTLGAAYAHFAASLLAFAGIVIVFTKITELSKLSLLSVMWRPMFASIAMALIIYGDNLPLSFLENFPQAIILIAKIIIGFISYSTTLLVLWFLAKRPNSSEKLVVELICQRILKRYFSYFF